MHGSPADYRGARIGLLTQHHKELVIGPVLSEKLGCHVERIGGYDTDTLGTFTREIPRFGDHREAAHKKAQLAIEHSQIPLGLGSEGAFGPDPVSGFIPWNLELLVFIDSQLGIEVEGVAQGPALHSHKTLHTLDELRTFAQSASFPSHQLVLRPNDEHDSRISKGIDTWERLEECFRVAKEQSESGSVFVEHDLRAHCSPTRQKMIEQAARNLAERLASSCPGCSAPGFWVNDVICGRSCAHCGQPTREARAKVWKCVRCRHSKVKTFDEVRASTPGVCDYCNP